MAIENGKLTNGFAKLVNGRMVEIPLSDVGKVGKTMNDKDRLMRYKGERGEIDNMKRGYR